MIFICHVPRQYACWFEFVSSAGANNTTPVRARGNGQHKYLILPILSPLLEPSSRLNLLFRLRDPLC